MPLWNEIRLRLRFLGREPGFSLAAVLTLGLGIGACTAIFTVVNAVLLRPLPFPEPERLVQLFEVSEKSPRMNVPEANFLDWQEGSRSFAALAMFRGSETTIRGASQPVRARVAYVSSGFFEVLGVRPALGRLPSAEEHRRGAAPVAMVSFAFWQRLLGAEADLAGKTLGFGNRLYSVVGVMPADFAFPPDTEVWAAMEMLGPVNPSRSAHNWSVLARLETSASLDAARAELSGIARRIHRQHRDVTATDAAVVPLQEQMTARVRTALWVLFASVGALLLVACANVTHLLLARATSRQREFAVRAALGASRTELIRELLSETLVLSLAGACLGVALARICLDLLLALGPARLPRTGEIQMDGEVLGFGLALSLLTALAIGLVPALRLPSSRLQDALREGGRGQFGGSRQQKVRGLLVVSQLALTLLLLVGAGLLARSFWRLLQVELGFETGGRLAIELSAPSPRDPREARLLASFHQQALERVAALPGVLAAGGINALPITRSGGNGRFLIQNRGDSGEYWPNYRVASAGYFTAMNIALLRGRLFDGTDGPETPQVALVSRAVAERVWPGEDPLGQRINTGNMDGDERFMTVVGIVGDVRDRGPEAGMAGEIYVHYLQRPLATSNFTLVARTAGDPGALVASVRAELRALEPELPVRFRTLEELVRASLADRRFNLTLLLAFGGTALLLATLGIYGVVAYGVAQRVGEIGIRMALGADRRQVVRLFLGAGGRLVLLGVLLGLAGALAAGRLLSSLLYEVSPADPLALALAAVPLGAAALLACYLPARKATRVDPLIALRSE
jgi:predicted permease